MKRYLSLAQEIGRYPTVDEWRTNERLHQCSLLELASFADYLAIAQRSQETFNPDNLHEDINQLQ